MVVVLGIESLNYIQYLPWVAWNGLVPEISRHSGSSLSSRLVGPRVVNDIKLFTKEQFCLSQGLSHFIKVTKQSSKHTFTEDSDISIPNTWEHNYFRIQNPSNTNEYQGTQIQQEQPLKIDQLSNKRMHPCGVYNTGLIELFCATLQVPWATVSRIHKVTELAENFWFTSHKLIKPAEFLIHSFSVFWYAQAYAQM